MIKQYIQQALAGLRQQPVISGVSIAGTALAIFLIMLVVMTEQVRTAPFAPESARDRFLHARYASLANKNWGTGTSNGPMSLQTARRWYASLPDLETATIYLSGVVSIPVNLPGQPSVEVDLRETDDRFWHVFDFAFLAGKPYDQATFDAGVPVAVLTASVARRLFGTLDCIGQTFLLAHAPYRVCGVVRDVSTLADTSYAMMWAPFTASKTTSMAWNDNLMGVFSVTLLAKSRADFARIKQDANRRMDELNQALEAQGYAYIGRNRPYTQEEQVVTHGANNQPNLGAARRRQWVVFLILLIVPAINLSSITQSRLRQRVAEIGVRRAFGSTRTELMFQLIGESLVTTLLAGLAGLLLSVGFAYVAGPLLFAQPFSNVFNPPMVDGAILLHASTFLWALLFCFLLNLLSSALPAWRASRISIVNALGGKV